MIFPVRGFFVERGFLVLTEKLPNPLNSILLSPTRALAIVSNMMSTARLTSCFCMDSSLLTLSTSSFFNMPNYCYPRIQPGYEFPPCPYNYKKRLSCRRFGKTTFLLHFKRSPRRYPTRCLGFRCLLLLPSTGRQRLTALLQLQLFQLS